MTTKIEVANTSYECKAIVLVTNHDKAIFSYTSDGNTSNQNYSRVPIKSVSPGFVVHVYLEGYRSDGKGTWCQESFCFDNLEEALAFDLKLGFLELYDRSKFDEVLDIPKHAGYSLEDCKIIETKADGAQYEWERNYEN